MHHGYQRPVVEHYTTWYNPLPVLQYVDLYQGNERRPTRYEFPPTTETKLPSRFDSAIHRVQCMDEVCRKTAPGFCTKPGEHQGVIIGGLAPQLQRRGAHLMLDPALDPLLSEKKYQEAELAAQVNAARHAEAAMQIALQKKNEAEDAAKAAERAREIADGKPAKK